MSGTYWWIILGYQPFEMGRDGFPRTGQVIKYYRERKKDNNGKKYTQSVLANILHISEQGIRDIENRDQAMDIERRRFLSELLDIPPILLGVVTLDEMQKLADLKKDATNTNSISTPLRTGKKLVVDTKEYGEHLTQLITTHMASSAHVSKSDALIRLDTIYHELPHVNDANQLEMRMLLCRYHDFVADILRDEQMYSDAMKHADSSVRIAEYLQKVELIALTLHKKGHVYYDSERLDDAKHAYGEAKEYEKRIPRNLTLASLLELARSISQTPHTDKEGDVALALVDSVGINIRNAQIDDDPYLISMNLDRYHLARSATLIAIGRYQDAIDELIHVRIGSTCSRRQAYRDTLLGQAYISKGQYEIGIISLESALDIAYLVNSAQHVNSIVKVYRQLQKSPYKDSPDVARLGYMLRPYLVISH